MEEGGRVDVELPVNRKVLWDRGADKIQLNKPNRASRSQYAVPHTGLELKPVRPTSVCPYLIMSFGHL